MTAIDELAATVFELQQEVKRLGSASQAGNSTVGGAAAIPVAGVVEEAAITNAALPEVQEDIADNDERDSALAAMLAERDADLDARLEQAAADLEDAKADIADSQQDIDAAFGETVDGLSEDVTTAITAAGAAGQVAAEAKQSALDAAGIANGKGEVIVQVTAPSGSRANPANLWIDVTLDANGKPRNTPNRFNPDTAKWEAITDQKVIDAAAAALAAQATADGKPLILFSTSAPSGTAPTGSIWFMWDSSKLVAGQWLQSGTLAAPVWTPQQIRSEVIANLDVAKLTAGSAAIADLVAQKIAASTANFQTANVSNLFVTSGATMTQAVIDFLFVNVVQAKKITAAMIDATTFTGVTFTGTIMQTAASGKRVVMSNNRLNFYGLSGSTAVNAGVIEGIPNGASGGLISIGPGTNESHLQIGTQALPTSGTATVRGNGIAWFDGVFANDYAMSDGSSLVTGTDWVNLSPAVGFTGDTSSTMQVCRIGSEVFVRGQITKDGGANIANGDNLFLLPAGFRPGRIMRTFLAGNAGSIVRVSVSAASGAVTVIGAPGPATTTYAYLDSLIFLNK